MAKHLYNNTAKFTRFLLRRDRIQIPIWIITLTIITLLIGFAFTDLYGSVEERQAMVETMSNPAVIAMLGPVYGIDDYHFGAIMAHQMLLFTALTVGIMSILMVGRHTRGDEEEGRIEMLRSLPVGRLSNLSATLWLVVGTNIFLALLIGLGLAALGVEGMDFNGSMLYGAVLGVTGIVFAAFTALFAQLSENSRGTMGLSFMFLVGAYMLRAVGDVSSEVLSIISPLGLVLRTETYVNNFWWPVLATGAVSALVIALAMYLNSIRDLDAGFIPAKPGRKTASAFLQSPLGLGIRLQRTTILIWAIGMFVLGASYGSVMGDLDVYIGSNDMIRDMIPSVAGFTLTELFLTMLLAVIAMVCTIPPLLVILKVWAEEKKNRTEHLFARAVSRNKVLGSFLGISIVVGLGILLLAAVGLWSVSYAVMDDPISFNTIINGSLVYFIAMLAFIGLAVFLIGFYPKGTKFTWIYLGYSVFAVYFGGALRIPDWMINLTPFGLVPQIPVDEVNYLVLFLLTLAAVGLMAAGFVGYSKRDLQG